MWAGAGHVNLGPIRPLLSPLLSLRHRIDFLFQVTTGALGILGGLGLCYPS